ncbi:hypothetical protein GC194_12240 [bacterium]|nr:hypothetical protein [bacterium]
MKQELRTRQKMSRVQLIAVVGSVMLITVFSLLFFGTQFFWSNKSKAGTDTATEGATEYWTVNEVSPSVFTDMVSVEVQSRYQGSLLLKLFDEEGKVVFRESLDLAAGANEHVINNLESLAQGRYVLEISGEDKTEKRELTKGH